MKKAKTISYDDLPALKKGYDKATKNKEDSFTIETPAGEAEFFTNYAKYLIEYWEQYNHGANIE